MKRFLVTGGAGFIGSNLCEMLTGGGHRVRVLDNLFSGKRENLAAVADSIEFMEGDIRDERALKEAMEGIDYCIHLAAIGSVPLSVEDPATTHEVNATGTLNVLRAALAAGVRKVVYASTCAVYGDDPRLPKTEEMTPTPKTPYATTKLMGEHYCANFSDLYGLSTTSFRYFNVYGRRQDPASHYAAVIPKFITALLKGEAPVIFGDGEQSRDFIYVDDLNRANMLAAMAEEESGQVYNLGTGRSVTVNELFTVIRNCAGRLDIEPVYGEERKGDIKHSRSDISKVRGRLGFNPRFDMERGLAETVRYYEETAP
ncbi:MAG TPA: SDR family oxidoreductase [Deltaproteobacteria bacterium]|nr:SDR family oxidoreductase [Deltaproteobacteria bacterium]